MAPVVLQSAAQLGLGPYAAMMGVSLAASAAFMTPFSHKANLIVMGSGGYRVVDYLRVGTPLTIVLLGGLGCLGAGGEESPAGIKAGGRATAGGGSAAGSGDLGELAALLREGAEPGQLSEDDKARLEEMLLLVLPETEGELAGLEWEVSYLDMDEGDFFSAELRKPASTRSPSS